MKLKELLYAVANKERLYIIDFHNLKVLYVGENFSNPELDYYKNYEVTCIWSTLTESGSGLCIKVMKGL